jgi:PLP dependent protein
MSIKQNLLKIQEDIVKTEEEYNRQPGSVLLLAVSKKQPIEKIYEAIAAGHKNFGESYAQEGVDKIKEINDSSLIWHFVGPIQSNKTKIIAENFAWVHSVDRLKIAQRLNKQRPVDLGPLNVCIEININDEASKAGIALTEIENLAHKIKGLPNLKLRGLMAIPDVSHDFAAQRKDFKKLSLAFADLNRKDFELDTLSMGMSADFEAAIAEGSTIVRIGTAVFGIRRE